MSAEQLVEEIIDLALTTGREKAEQADQYSERAITAAQGWTTPGYAGFDFTPGAIEPNVLIPSTASGVDGVLYDATYSRIVEDLSGTFAQFFATYFPNECDSLLRAQERLCDMLAGEVGIPSPVEDQIWQRDRSRVLADVNRTRDEVMSTFAARGFPLPPGAAAHAVRLAQADANDKIAMQSRDVAIKHVDILIENIKFAVQNALDYRMKCIQAAADYIRILAVGPEIAARLATSAADAQAQLISAAGGYYRNRIAVEELRLDAAKVNASLRNEISIEGSRNVTQARRSLAETLAAAARAAGDQAAAALNAVHASAGIAVQGETA